MSHSYALNPFHQFLSHGSPLPIALLRDGLDGIDNLREVDVQVMSGDYFPTLATTLDSLAQAITDTHSAEAEQIQRIVTDLLYLQQQNYQVIRKDKRRL